MRCVRIVKASVLFLPLLVGVSVAHADVQGFVLSDSGRVPIPAARVFVDDGESAQVMVHTNSEGRFTVVCRQGVYKIRIEKAGYFPLTLENVPVHGVETVALDPFVLAERHAIAGTVRWPDGEPASAASISILRATATGLVSSTAYPGGVRTDERGHFLAFGLRSGKYILRVDPGVGAGGRLSLPTYFPGDVAPDLSRALDLIAEKELSVDVRVEERVGRNIEGTVEISSTVPAGTPVSVNVVLPGERARRLISVSARAGTQFTILSVPPNIYSLVFIAQISGAIETGEQSVSVGGTDVTGVTLRFPKKADTSVTTEIESSTGRSGAAEVTVQAVSERLAASLPAATTNKDGVLTLSGGIPNEVYYLLASHIPPGSYMATLRQGDRIEEAYPFRALMNGIPVKITLRGDGGVLRGAATRDKRPAPGVFLALASLADRPAKQFRTALSDDSGRFQLTAIPPGIYDLFVFRSEQDFIGEPSLTEALAKQGHLTIRKGENAPVTIELPRLY